MSPASVRPDPPAPLRLALAEQHALSRVALLRLLRRDAGLRVVVEARHGEGLLRALERCQADVVVVDLSMSWDDSLAIIRRTQQACPSAGIVVLSMHADAQFAARALDAGARGYLGKDRAAAELLPAIRRVAAGDIYVSAAAA
jgi:two-component system, NarL family, invasion response regulator UvrY